MKKLHLLFAFTLACMLWSCDDEKSNNPIDFYVIESQTTLPATNSSGYIKVHAQGVVTAESDQPWCAATVNGETIDISVSPNTGLTERYAMITLRLGNKSQNVSVLQYGTITQFNNTDTIRVNYEAQIEEYTLVYSTVPITVSLDQTWLTATVGADNNITLDFTQNDDDTRIANLVISDGNLSKTVVVIQTGAFSVNQTELTFDDTGAPAQTVTVTYSGAAPTVTVADSWATATLTGNILTVSCSAATATRTTTITLTLGANTRIITVNQTFIPLIERLVGTWDVTETVLQGSNEINNDHVVTIELIDNTTILIKNFIGSDDEIIAKVNSGTAMLTIPFQEFIPTLNPSYRTWLAPMRDNQYCNNNGLDFLPVSIVKVSGKYTISFDNGLTSNVGGVPYPSGYAIIATDASGSCLGGFYSTAGTVMVQR